MNKRDSYLDMLKGIGILLVVFGHVCNGFASGLVYLFHMPLFFFLSGAALNYSKNNDFNWKARFKHILLPYYFFSIICFFYWFLIESKFRPVHEVDLFIGLFAIDTKWQQFVNIFLALSLEDAFIYNIVLWFLPCLFMALMIYVAIEKLFQQNAIYAIVVLVAISFLFKSLRLPLCVEISMAALPFIFAGEKVYLKIKNHYGLGGAFLLISILLIGLFNPQVDMRGHMYGVWWLFYLLAFSLIFSICGLSKCLVERDFGILKWLGQNSLIIMLIHEPVKRIILVLISKLLSIDVVTLRESLLMSICVTVLLVLLLIPFVIAINNFFPIVLGRRNNKKIS